MFGELYVLTANRVEGVLVRVWRLDERDCFMRPRVSSLERASVNGSPGQDTQKSSNGSRERSKCARRGNTGMSLGDELRFQGQIRLVGVGK